MMRHSASGVFLFACILISIFAQPAMAQTVEELKAELEAQKTINAALKQRIETLERQVASLDPAKAADGVFTPYSEPPPETELDPEEERALERAFERRGLSILPPGTFEVSPSLTWWHAGSARTNDVFDTFSADASIRVGLPGNFMVGARLPYDFGDRQNADSDSRVGNLTLQAWKALFDDGETMPKVVGQLGFSMPVEGNGLYSLGGRLSVSKSFDPIVFFGSAGYAHTFDRTIYGAKEVRPGEFAFAVGAGLAVTPRISMTAAFDLAFRDDIQQNGREVRGSAQTIGAFTLNTGVVLSKNVFLSVTGGVGLTDDSPDAVFGVAMPIRF